MHNMFPVSNSTWYRRQGLKVTMVCSLYLCKDGTADITGHTPAVCMSSVCSYKCTPDIDQIYDLIK